MKNRPIHENLETSYVNLSALIKYLRRRQFVGSIKIQLNGYKAEIHFQNDNQMNVSEHDQLAGRISSGEEALQRLLIRAREPGGTINVYQLIEEFAEQPKIEKSKEDLEDDLIIEAKIIEPRSNGVYQNGTNGVTKPSPLKEIPLISKSDLEEKLPEISKPKITKPETILPDFPFNLSNKVENKAKQKRISDEEWQTLLKLTVELLTVVDKSLATANLDFSAAFQKACLEISGDYPFINPRGNSFKYKNGNISMKERVNSKIFVASIMEAIRRILDKLESNPKFTEVHRRTVQTLIALQNKRQDFYDKFAITPQLKKILGI